MSTRFDSFVAELESNSTPAEKEELAAARRRFSVGVRLLEKRLASGLTQQQLAAASGIAQSDISRIERGQANPTVETLQALGAPLGVTLDFAPLGEHS